MNNIKIRLIVLNFLQFFIWGGWLISLGGYLGIKLGFSGGQIGAIYATIGISSIIMPGIAGIIADKWINGERLLGICHLLGAIFLYYTSTITDYHHFYIAMLINLLCFMPTISLDYSVSYSILTKNKFDVVKTFPPIRTFGTIGFIIAMWIVDISGVKNSSGQLVFSSICSLILGVYAFTLPPCKPTKTLKKSWLGAFGLDALVLFKHRQIVLFFLFSMLLGVTLQITNSYGELFLRSFRSTAEYADSFGVRHSILLLSVSQISETIFILTIPFFLLRFGIKKVILISMLAWALRFLFFGLGNPGNGIWFLLLSMVVCGMAFDFFNISGSLFIEKKSSPEIRSSAQGLFMVFTNGMGSVLGGYTSGAVVDAFSVYKNNVLISRDWQTIWFIFSGYALLISILFALFFKYSNSEKEKMNYGIT